MSEQNVNIPPALIQNVLQGNENLQQNKSNVKSLTNDGVVTTNPKFDMFGADATSLANVPNWTKRDMDLALGGLYPEEQIQAQQNLANLQKTKMDTEKTKLTALMKLAESNAFGGKVKKLGEHIYVVNPDGTTEWVATDALYETQNGVRYQAKPATHNTKYFKKGYPGSIGIGPDGKEVDPTTVNKQLSPNSNAKPISFNLQPTAIPDGSNQTKAYSTDGNINLSFQPTKPIKEIEHTYTDKDTGLSYKGSAWADVQTGYPILDEKGKPQWANQPHTIGLSLGDRMEQNNKIINSYIDNLPTNKYTQGLRDDVGDIQFQTEDPQSQRLWLASNVHNHFSTQPNILNSQSNSFSLSRHNTEWMTGDVIPMIHDRENQVTFSGTGEYQGRAGYFWVTDDFVMTDIKGLTVTGGQLDDTVGTGTSETLWYGISNGTVTDGRVYITNSQGEIQQSVGFKDGEEMTRKQMSQLYNKAFYNPTKNGYVYIGSRVNP